MDIDPTSPPQQPRLLEDPLEAKKFYDQRYRAGYMDEWPLEKRERVGDLVRELPLAAKGRVLDYGCGAGLFTAVLRSALPDWEVHGTDISTVALDLAIASLPDCRFHSLSDCEQMTGAFDLIFSHHVLEHVSDIRNTADTLLGLLSPGGAMLHILPCGDPGGLEANICAMRRDGVDCGRENLFFCDEEGHMRRLTSQGLVDLWSDAGFIPERVYHANRWFGAIEHLSAWWDLAWLWDFADPGKAVNAAAARRLHTWRAALVTLWFLRRPVAVIRYKLALGVHGPRDLATLLVALVLYPLSKPVDWLTRKLARSEWSRSRDQAGGSEMYVFLTPSAPH